VIIYMCPNLEEAEQIMRRVWRYMC
jgi:hypothetical protein